MGQGRPLRVERKVLQGAHYLRGLGSPGLWPPLPKSLELGDEEAGGREGGKEIGRKKKEGGGLERKEKTRLLRDKARMCSQEGARGPVLV